MFTAEDEMDEEDPTKNYKVEPKKYTYIHSTLAMTNVECDGLSCCPVVQKFAELRASLRANQSRLSEHGAAVMLLQVLASTGGQHPGALVQMCLHLGVALLKGGNHTVQRVRV